MGIRSLVLVSIVVTAFSLAPSARADVPNPTSSSSSGAGTGSSSSGGAGGSAPTNNPNCLVSAEAVAGTTCKECDPAKSCNQLDSTYNYVCQRTGTVQVWCNGPRRGVPNDTNVSCSVAVPGSAWGGVAAGGALAMAAAFLMRRRRRP